MQIHEYRCEVHNTPLKRGTAEVIYGIGDSLDKYPKAQQTLFPNSQARVAGGCLYSEDAPEAESVMFCPKCREAESQWKLFFGNL